MATNTRIALGKKIRALRCSNHLSQQMLALMTGVERSYLAQLESGKRNPGLDCLERIADGFGITLSELFDGVQQPKGGSASAQSASEHPEQSRVKYRHVDI